MALIILKIVLCSFLLLAFYHFFLAKERSFKFNRFYLILSLILAYALPFVEFSLPKVQPATATLIFGAAAADLQQGRSAGTNSIFSNNIIFFIYAVITAILLVKFLRSFLKILYLKGEEKVYKGQQIKVITENVAPFSFYNTIFLSRSDYNGGNPDERIFLHEKCHVQEKHSWDILFLEVLRIFTWFNPALFLYKKAMRSNHEFLADDFVLRREFDLRKYQHLILNNIELSGRFPLSHQFNFNNTKKRFIMMTTKNSKLFWVKRLALLPIAAVLIVFFTKEVKAQKTPEKTAVTPENATRKEVTPLSTKTSVIFEGKKPIPSVKEFVDQKSTQNDTLRKKEKTSDTATPPPPPPPPAEAEKNLPQFPQGVDEYRKLVANVFDTSVLKDAKGVLRTTAFIEIDEKGNVSAIKVEGDNEAFNRETERTMKAVNKGQVWIPATENGQPVKSVFRMPLTMQFE